MKRGLSIMILTVFLVMLPTITFGEQKSPSSAPQASAEDLAKRDVIVRGKLLKFDDRSYTVETAPGSQLELRADKATKFEGDYRGMPGDWIEVTASPEMLVRGLKKSTPGYTLEGDVLKVERDFFVIKDMSGKEIRLQMGKDTNIMGSHKVGERIRVQYTPEGQAISITSARPMAGTQGPAAAGAQGP
jgi:hypothetical protein